MTACAAAAAAAVLESSSPWLVYLSVVKKNRWSSIVLYSWVFCVEGVASKSKTRSPAPPLPPLSTRHAFQTRSQSLIEPSQTSPSLTVALPPMHNLNLSGAPPIPPRPGLQRSLSAAGATSSISPNSASKAGAAAVSPIAEIDESADNMANECKVCFEKACDCVIYTCGHMCMCYGCAKGLQASPDPLCPICRQEIKDVIRIYKS